MTQQLSPAAQAVAWAYDNMPERPTGNHRYHWLGYALRAAADQVVPPEQKTPWGSIVQAHAAELRVRNELIAIAAELEAQ